MEKRPDHAAEAIRLIDECLAEEEQLLEELKEHVEHYGDMTWEEADQAIRDFKAHRREENNDVEQS